MTFHQLRQALHTELNLWRMKRKSETVKAKQLDTPTKALSFVDKDYFPSIYVILAISATLAVTSCECEKLVSVLKFTAKKDANHILIPQVIISVSKLLSFWYRSEKKNRSLMKSKYAVKIAEDITLMHYG